MFSLCLFDVLYKYEIVFAKGVHFYKTKLDQETILRLPFATTPTTLIFTYLLSVILLFTSHLPLYSLALYQYKLSFRKLQSQFNAFLQNKQLNKLTTSTQQQQQQPNDQNYMQTTDSAEEIYSEYINPNEIQCELSSNYSNYYGTQAKPLLFPTPLPPNSQTAMLTHVMLNRDLKESISIYSNSSNRVHVLHRFDQLQTTKNNTQTFIRLIFSALKSYSHSFQALFIAFSLFCSFSYLFIDALFLYQITQDKLAALTCLSQLTFLIYYFLIWTYLSFVKNLNFTFTHAFKLNYWYILNKILNNPSKMVLKPPPETPIILEDDFQQQDNNNLRLPLTPFERELSTNVLAVITDEKVENECDSFVTRKRALYENFNLDLKKNTSSNPAINNTQTQGGIHKFQKRKNSTSLNSIVEDDSSSYSYAKKDHHNPYHSVKNIPNGTGRISVTKTAEKQNQMDLDDLDETCSSKMITNPTKLRYYGKSYLNSQSNLNEANRKLLNKILLKHKELIDGNRAMIISNRPTYVHHRHNSNNYKYYGSNSVSNIQQQADTDQDSGRHSLAESPSSANNIIGSFTSKCIFTSGNECTFTPQPKSTYNNIPRTQQQGSDVVVVNMKKMSSNDDDTTTGNSNEYDQLKNSRIINLSEL